MFRTLVFHEIRPDDELNGEQRPIAVQDGYQDSLPLPLFDSLTLFKERINYLIEENYHFLSIAEILTFYEEQKALPEKSILLTFDDCYQSMKTYAYPVLKEAGITAAAFVVSGWLAKQPEPYHSDLSQVLSFEELREMDDVFESANHTDHFHERRGTTMAKSMWETPAHFRKDLEACNHWVKWTNVFAYPFGLYDQQTISVLADLQFKLAFTTKSGMNTQQTNPLELCREVIPAAMPLEAFKKIVETEGYE